MNALAESSEVLYIEVVDFYAEVERRRAHGLMSRPILVGGDPQKKGKLQSASLEARECGVILGMPMREALQVCPAAVRLPTDLSFYREAHGQLEVCLRRLLDGLEVSSLGSAYAEIRIGVGRSRSKAEEIVAAVRADLGLPIRVGIGPSKWVASLVVQDVARSGVAEVRREHVKDFLDRQPVSRLPRVGGKAQKRLNALGADTLGKLLALGPEVLTAELGSRAEQIIALAHGEDSRPVRASEQPKTLSRGQTLPGVPGHSPEVKQGLQRLANGLAALLTRRGLKARRLSIRLRFEDQSLASRSLTLPEPSDGGEVFYEAAALLLRRVDRGGQGLKSVSLTVGGISTPIYSDPQLDLFLPPQD
ncbi:MAG: hypothetical protein CBC48_09495 [bacterium TMED88]|nr:hypothetical protein [Deltaproteobacteria bacterium]OUV31688.1 MAG: hypothetical protein CBC48_09495 [bacterium TMED88]